MGTRVITLNSNYFWADFSTELLTDLGKLKFAYGGSILGSIQFTLLPQLLLNTMLDLKVVKIDSKIIISLH